MASKQQQRAAHQRHYGRRVGRVVHLAARYGPRLVARATKRVGRVLRRSR
jgi:hypothetical protein